MAWGEAHMMMGAMAGLPCINDPWKLALAIPIAVLTHWPLDDLNVGKVAMVYHGMGRGWKVIVGIFLRMPLIAAISFLFWNNPILLATGIPAWLILDHEWVLNIFGRHGYGLHKRMWPAWLKRPIAMWFWIAVLYLWVLLLV
jgi:hypothetical protein